MHKKIKQIKGTRRGHRDSGAEQEEEESRDVQARGRGTAVGWRHEAVPLVEARGRWAIAGRRDGGTGRGDRDSGGVEQRRRGTGSPPAVEARSRRTVDGTEARSSAVDPSRRGDRASGAEQQRRGMESPGRRRSVKVERRQTDTGFHLDRQASNRKL